MIAEAPTDAAVATAMRRALEAARLGPPGGPNPQVGCVVLGPDGAVLAEGHHRGAGTPHAEVAALAVLPPGAAAGTTVVVTLEPCDHTGRTGPCSIALIEAGVARVVVAQPEPNPLAAGGAARLRAAGIAVDAGPFADEAAELNARWAASLRLGRPWVTVKWASSLDGRVAAEDGTSRWITGPEARADAHRLRAQHGAVLVGSGTVLADDPALTVRIGSPAHQPRPVVLGRRDLPAEAALNRHPRPPLHVRDRDPRAALAALTEEGVTSVLVEGGPTVASAFLAAGLADEVRVHLAPTLLGGGRSATGDLGVRTIADQRRLAVRDVQRLGDDLVVVARPVDA